MPAEASRSGRAGPEPTPDAGRSPAIDRPVQHAPQATRRRPRSTPPARKDENPPEAIRPPARNDPPREPRMSDGRLRRSPRHRSAEAITVSGLTFDMRGMPRLAGACPLDGRVGHHCRHSYTRISSGLPGRPRVLMYSMSPCFRSNHSPSSRCERK